MLSLDEDDFVDDSLDDMLCFVFLDVGKSIVFTDCCSESSVRFGPLDMSGLQVQPGSANKIRRKKPNHEPVVFLVSLRSSSCLSL